MAAALLATKGGARPATPADTAAAEPAARRKAANGNGLSSHLSAVDGGQQSELAPAVTEPRGEGDASPAASLTSAHFLRPRRAHEPAPVAETEAKDAAAEPQPLEPAESLESVEPSLSAIEESGEPERTPADPETPKDAIPGDAASVKPPTDLAPDGSDSLAAPGSEAPGLEVPGPATPGEALDAAALQPTVAALNSYGARSTSAQRERGVAARREQRRNNGTLVALVALGAALAVGIGWYSTNLPAPEQAPLERLKGAVGAAQQKDPAAPAHAAPIEAVTGDGADYLPSAALGAEATQQAAVAPGESASAPAAKPASAPAAPAVDVVRIEAGSAVIAGTGAPGSALIVLDKGEPIGTAQVDGNGQWVLIPDTVLPEGDHEISLVVKDEQGTVKIPKKE